MINPKKLSVNSQAHHSTSKPILKMPKVLILGATGYVGKRVADTLVRSGQHQVYGVARSSSKAKDLALAEITPVICEDPINTPEPYLDVVRAQNIDIIVDLAGPGPDSAKFLDHAKLIAQERASTYKAAGLHKTPKLGFIYCSGTWVHGSSDKAVNDLDMAHEAAATQPGKLVAWRTGLENSILGSSDLLDVAIVRPGLIYGRENTIWTPFILPLLQAAQKGEADSLKVNLEPDSRPGLIHVDDVATGFQCVIERLSLINGSSIYPVFDLVTSQESMVGVFDALARTWGFKGKVDLIGAGDDLFAQAMSTSFHGSSARARQLLGWEPKRLAGFVADVDLYGNAFASQHP